MNKKLIILGGGESGVGAALLGVSKSYDVFLSDSGQLKDSYKETLIKHQIAFEEGTHSRQEIMDADIVVKSPGIPDNVSLIKDLLSKGIPVISEIEFAHQYTDAKIIAVTGSNGKTTTTLWIYHILKNAGLNVGLGGNIGKSFAEQVIEDTFDYFVLELSSFQLDGVKDFKADIAILLNITPDHLDRYDYKFENYVKSKFKITNNQTQDDAFIYCKDDETIKKYLAENAVASSKYSFSINEKVIGNGAYIDNGEIILSINNNSFSMSIHKLALQGKHNVHNSMASGITAKLLELRNEQIRESLSDFDNVEHRLEFVAKVNGRSFINDSKATNVNSTWYALDNASAQVVWIAGGVDKGNDYSDLMDLVKDKVKAIVCLGKDNEKIIETFSGVVEEIVEVDSAVLAVNSAYTLSKSGDTVLLSPACASFDLFDSYEDRGTQFKAAVRSL